jgi:PAS domain S-box-containing protein
LKTRKENNSSQAANLAGRLAAIYGRVVITAALIFAALVTVLLVKQYYDKKNQMIRSATDDLEERAISVDYFLSNAAEDVIESKIWAQDYLNLSRDNEDPPELPKTVRLDTGGKIHVAEPPHKDIYGNIVLTDSEIPAGSDAIRQIDMAFKLFEVQRINHYAPPDFTWSEFYSTKGFGSVYPWSASDKSVRILQRRVARDMLRQFETSAADLKQRNPFESRLWSEAYVDVPGRGLMITCGSPVFDGDRFIGMVSAEMSLDFFSHFVEKQQTANGAIMIVNSRKQILSTTGMKPRLMERVPVFGNHAPGLDLESIFNTNPGGAGYLHSGKNHIISTRLNNADWAMIKIMPESDIMRAFFPEALFGAVVVGLMFGFLAAANRVMNRYFVKPALGFVDFIEAEATTGRPAPRPKVPPVWEQWFIRMSDTLALKSVAANLPGAIFQLKKTGSGNATLTIVSSGVEQLLGVAAEDLVNRDAFTLNFLSGRNAEQFKQKLRDSESDLKPFAFETAVTIPSGKERWVRFILRPRKERDEPGETMWDGLMLDISDRKRLEDQLLEHRDRLEETVASRTGELKNVNEELRREIQERIKSEAALKVSEERIRAMSQKAIRAQDDERERLSRELHDEIGQQFAAVLFQLPAIKNKPCICPDDIVRIEHMIRDIGEDLHRICKGLQPMTLTQFGLAPALKMLLWEFMETYGAKIVTDIESPVHCPDNELAAAAYRICQEAVSNSIRHSGAEKILVSLKQDARGIELTVRDNGRGFDMDTAKDKGNLGLSGMKRRAEQSGGRLEIESAPGRGARVAFSHPALAAAKDES